MANQKLISFDLRADFGFFKKPDYNDGILLSYNMIHKPALLGILGAIIGLKGYSTKGEFSEYYQRLKDLPVGIEPINHEKGNFQKTTVKYSNTVGYANDDGNLLVEEMMLIRPAYRCYLLLDVDVEDQQKLYEYLKAGQAEYIPYLGKNEFQATWLTDDGESTFREYMFDIRQHQSGKVKLATLFQKGTMIVKEAIVDESAVENYIPFNIVLEPDMFMYFERLPIGFVSQQLIQYDLQSHVYSSFSLKDAVTLPGLYFLKEIDSYVQLT